MKFDNVFKSDTGEIEAYYTVGHVNKEEFWQELILKLGTQTVIELTLLAIARANFKLEECLNANVLHEYWIKKDDLDLMPYEQIATLAEAIAQIESRLDKIDPLVVEASQASQDEWEVSRAHQAKQRVMLSG